MDGPQRWERARLCSASLGLIVTLTRFASAIAVTGPPRRGRRSSPLAWRAGGSLLVPTRQSGRRRSPCGDDALDRMRAESAALGDASPVIDGEASDVTSRRGRWRQGPSARAGGPGPSFLTPKAPAANLTARIEGAHRDSRAPPASPMHAPDVLVTCVLSLPWRSSSSAWGASATRPRRLPCQEWLQERSSARSRAQPEA